MKAPSAPLTTSGRVKKKPGRVPVSCSECRRLKMKCDRAIPCENCTKRGCASICPDGVLTTGKHNRMILANTEELHDQIEALQARVKALEEALRILQASVSTQPHPLLSQLDSETIHIPVPPSALTQSSAIQREEAHDVGASDQCIASSQGTLIVGPDEEMTFLGPSARTDYLMLHDEDEDEEDTNRRLPRHFYFYTWPEPPLPNPNLEETLQSFLPEFSEARVLCEIYASVAEWLGFLLPTSIIFDEFLAQVYHPPKSAWADTPNACPQRMALLFSIFALSIFFDPTRRHENSQASEFYQLARVALSCKSRVQDSSIYTIFTLINMCHYLSHQDSSAAQERGYLVLGIAARIALAMGLHRDSSKWDIDETLRRKRHAAFWQLYMLENHTDIYFGRLNFFEDSVIDCPLPDNVASSDPRQHYFLWLIDFLRFAKLTTVQMFRSSKSSYTMLLEQSAKVRGFPEPDWEHMRRMLDQEDPMSLKLLSVKRACATWYREILLLYLHRGYLVEALNDSDSPQNPLTSRYGHSIRLCYESSRQLGISLLAISSAVPHIVTRTSCWFSAALLSTIIMALIATRCPTAEFAQSAVQELDTVYITMRQLGFQKKRALKDLDVIQRYRDAAHASLLETNTIGDGTVRSSSLQSKYITPEDIKVMERCCGKTQTYLRRRSAKNGHSAPSSSTSLQPQASHTGHVDIDQRAPIPIPRLPQAHERRPISRVPRPFPVHADVAGPSSIAPAELPRVPGLSGGSEATAYSEDIPRFTSFAGWMNEAYSQGFDPSWTNFIQQLGF